MLQAVAKEFGPEWAREHIVPQVRTLHSCLLYQTFPYHCHVPHVHQPHTCM